MTSGNSNDFGFFRIIFESTLEEKMLILPEKFVRLYGETLSSSVFLIPPCGSKWKIGLKKKNGKVWLQQGWAEFAKQYPLVYGHLLFFTYQGNSRFQISICDTSTCEIDECDINGPNKGKTKADDNVDKIFGNSDDDNSFEIFDCSLAEEESLPPLSLSCKRTCKRMKTCGKGMAHGEKYTTQKESKAKQRARMPLRDGKAYEEASKFYSIKPFFKKVLTRAYNLRLPGTFVKRHIGQKPQTIILEVGARSWRVQLLCCNTGYFFCGGYHKFVKENSLGRGDVCIFELKEMKNRNKVVMNVKIFRCNSHQSLL